MWTNKAVSDLQKTYDESYLKCSTAVYYESQGNEKEARRYWKEALDRISHNTPNKPSYAPRSETERTLIESIKELEIQCKERIDLLEALRLSRQDGPLPRDSPSENISGAGTSSDRGWIGDGTIPALTYPELTRPPLPARPSMASRTSSEQAVVGGRSASCNDLGSQLPTKTTPSLPPYAGSPRRKASRSPSPDKRTMRTTLRSGRSEKTAKLTRRGGAKASERPGASKAATLAWSSIASRDSRNQMSSSAPSMGESRRSLKQTRKPTSTPHSQWDSHTRRLLASAENGNADAPGPESPSLRQPEEYSYPGPSTLAVGAASSALTALSMNDRYDSSSSINRAERSSNSKGNSSIAHDAARASAEVSGSGRSSSELPIRRKALNHLALTPDPKTAKRRTPRKGHDATPYDSISSDDEAEAAPTRSSRRRGKEVQKEDPVPADITVRTEDSEDEDDASTEKNAWEKKKKAVLKHLPPGVDSAAAKAIFNEIVVHGDEVHWSDVAGLEVAKNALREAVVYPFLRPDLFKGLREPARGMLLFGPPGTGKTMLARAVATESKSTFFSISASSLTSKYLGESEKLVRALFALAKAMAPSIIFVDEIDSLLSQRSGSGEHEATRRIKTEFLIQWSDLQRAAAGRESLSGDKESRGDPHRVLVLAATNLPWAIDEAARRRFVRRQYIPLPEAETRATQLRTLLGQQKHSLTDSDISELVLLTDGFSGSDITALAKDAAMGPLRSLGEALLQMTMDQIRPIELDDFKASLRTIRPSVSKEGLKGYDDWARQYGERGG